MDLGSGLPNGGCHVGALFRKTVNGRSHPCMLVGSADRALRRMDGDGRLRHTEYLSPGSHVVSVCRVRQTAWFAPPGLDRGGRSAYSGMNCLSACSIPEPANSCANMCARDAAGFASSPKITASEPRSAFPNCCGRPLAPAPTLALSAWLEHQLAPESQQ